MELHFYRGEVVYGVVVLGQGYDEGWIAYAIDRNDQSSMTNDQTNSNTQIPIYKRIAPWWFGERLEQVKVNGWSNGFLVTSDQEPGTSNIVLVYWPQYLQWGGFLGLGVVVIWLVGGGIRGRFFGPKTS